MSGHIVKSIGLMSGTSMDGVDVALLETDGEGHVRRGPFLGIAYDDAMRSLLKAALVAARPMTDRNDRSGELSRMEREITQRHVDAVSQFLSRYGILASSVDLIGFHGQTVLHRPDEGLTVQLGDGALLARETGIRTVFDMRANDMLHGGQGAPLVPVYHRALAGLLRRNDPGLPVAFVNIGGISNLTFIGGESGPAEEPRLVAFDSGPGNMLIDQWMDARAGLAFDAGGQAAARGVVIPDLAETYLRHEFFSAPTRRSLDRGDFTPPENGSASLEDGARTLAFVAAAAIIRSCEHLPAFPRVLAVAGGGRLNAVIMAELTQLASDRGSKVIAVEDAGLDGDAMEAEAWAYLAVRALRGLPLTFPGTTGVRVPVTGGTIAEPDGSR